MELYSHTAVPHTVTTIGTVVTPLSPPVLPTTGFDPQEPAGMLLSCFPPSPGSSCSIKCHLTAGTPRSHLGDIPMCLGAGGPGGRQGRSVEVARVGL